jgi:5'-nucleotidase
MMKRRDFIEILSIGSLASALGKNSYLDILNGDLHKLTILHTNDWHSRIEPFPMDGSRNQGLGGASKRATLIQKIRLEEENVLLFDCGDIFQGTPYFNFYSGELEIKLMNQMKYDAATIGNHDFDAGIENLGEKVDLASFAFLNANYGFQNKNLKEQVKDYSIFERGGIRVGVFGLGIELDGLVPENLHGGTQYMDPVQKANQIADHLRDTEKCDLVVCLSHLGYSYRSSKISDRVIAKESKNIDVILGGHTHTFMKEAAYENNKRGKAVLINQVGWAGILLGRIDIYFEKISGWRWNKGRSFEIS